jgi:hypothetical protein
MIGSPTPMRVPLVMQRQLPSADLAFPIAPQEWRFRQSVDYSISLNRAVLDYASRMRENVLYNIYAMGRRSIARGSTDSWTPNPKRYASVASQVPTGASAADMSDDARRAAEARAWSELRKPELRDPRAYVLNAHQRDFATATKFINALRETGIAIHRATQPFAIAGKSYPAGSFVVWTAQSFRPHVLDMFEPQVHPDVFPYPGAPPTPPYDNAGWTLAFQMGVEVDRILDPITIPGLERVTAWNLPMPPGRITAMGRSGGFVMQRRENNAYIAANRLLKAGQIVRVLPGGALFVRSTASNRQLIEGLGAELGVNLEGTGYTIPPNAPSLRPARIGLWDQYGGSMDAGWARWILEQFEFPFERVFAPRLDAGNLERDFDVLVFVGGGIPAPAPRRGGSTSLPIPDIPAEFLPHVGRVTSERTLPRLREFLEAGGTVVAIGESAPPLARFLGLPIENHLVENGAPLPRTKVYIPGSVLSARVDTTRALAAGMRPSSDFFFDDSPVFRLGAGAAAAGVTPIAWFDSANPLRSGWAWGQHYLKDGVIAAEAKIGKGRAILYAPEILKRAQPHGTFKLLFNALYQGGT